MLSCVSPFRQDYLLSLDWAVWLRELVSLALCFGVWLKFSHWKIWLFPVLSFYTCDGREWGGITKCYFYQTLTINHGARAHT